MLATLGNPGLFTFRPGGCAAHSVTVGALGLEVKHVGPRYSLRQALLQPGRSDCRPIGSLFLALRRRSTGATALSPASSVLQDPEDAEDPEQSSPLSRLEGGFDGGVHPSRRCADDQINAEQRHSTTSIPSLHLALLTSPTPTLRHTCAQTEL